MKYGMNLLLWSGEIVKEHYPILEKLKEFGYDGVEVPIFNLELSIYEKLGKKLDELGLECTAVTVRNEEDNPISSDNAARAAGVANNKLALNCCAAMKAQNLVGPYHSAIGIFSGSGPTEDEFKWGVDSMRQTAEYAATVGVTLGVEYLNRFECYFLTTIADDVRFVQAVDHPSCKLMYDTFHANIEERSLGDAIRTAAPHLCHVHISENDRSTPGVGHVAWKETFDTLKEIGYDGWMVVEAFGLSLPELAAATKIWRRMYESELQLAADALTFMKKEVAARG
jgi:D-psicose/D-tagatose/L-ribulose 3-epimerase